MADRRDGSRSRPWLLTWSAVASGLLSYAFFAMSARALGPAGAGPVSSLWAYWGIAGAAVTFPIQHWIGVTAVLRGEGAVRRGLRRIWAGVLVASPLVGLAAFAARELLFFSSGAAFPLLVVLVTVGSALIGVARGGLAARSRFRLLAGLLIAENAVRSIAAAALWLGGVTSPVAFGLALVAGQAIPLLSPSLLRFGGDVRRSGSTKLRSLGGTSVGQLLSQVALTGGPLVLAAAGGLPAEVSVLFVTLALFRAPYTIALGVVPVLTDQLARTVLTRGEAALRRPRLVTLVATLLAAPVAAFVGALAGPWAVALVFGDEYVVSPMVAGVVAAASALAVANLVLAIVLVVRGQGLAITHAWAAAVVAGGITAAGMVWADAANALLGVAVAFLIAEATGMLGLATPYAPRAVGTQEGGGPKSGSR